MYSGIEKINEVIEYIEANIFENLDINSLAAKMNLSVYEFRRIFSFVVGSPISEYIRKRRLSLAACEILTQDNIDMVKLSQKYGYSSQSAFIKAFNELHGVSPTAILKEGKEINLFTRPEFELSVKGKENIPFKIINSDEFTVSGYSEISYITDTCCCEAVWNNFYESGTDKRLAEISENKRLYALYQNDKANQNVACTIGAVTESKFPDLTALTVPKSRWACFKLTTTDDDTVNEQYSKILYEWLPSANLKRRNDLPILEVYPFDMSKDGFNWEIRIPVC